MSSRALSLATVMLLIGCWAAVPVQAQNLEAGKSPSQIFAGTCSGCHRTSRGLLKTVSPGSLPGFLREHYTTSGDMASVLSAFLISNGAGDRRFGGDQPRQGRAVRQEIDPASLSEPSDRPGRRLRSGASPQEASRPDAARPTVDGQAPDQAASEREGNGRQWSKRKLGKRGRPAEELPKIDAAKTDAEKADAAKAEPAKDESAKGGSANDDRPNSDTARDQGGKAETNKAEASKTEAAKIEMPKETPATGAVVSRPDPVPPVTPAPSSSAAASSSAPAVTVSAPQPAPVVPSGPPVPPISR